MKRSNLILVSTTLVLSVSSANAFSLFGWFSDNAKKPQKVAWFKNSDFTSQ